MVMRKKKIIMGCIIFGMILLGAYFLLEIASKSFFIILRERDKYSCESCNVILIVINSLRYDHLSSSGYFRETSPTIDNLSNKIFFENAFSHAPAVIGRMSLFTALYPHNHGVLLKNRDVLDSKIPTATQIFKNSGYETVYFGPLKMDDMNLSDGFDRGFDEFFPGNGNQIPGWISENRNEKFFIYYHEFITHEPYLPSSDNRFSDNYTGSMIDSREKLSKKMFEELKKLLIENPEGLYRIFEKEFVNSHRDLFSGDYSLEKAYGWSSRLSALGPQNTNSYWLLQDAVFWGSLDLTDEKDLNHLKTLYDSRIFDADSLIKNIIDTVERLNLSSKTVVIITADHGEEFMEHGQIDHNQLYEEVIHIPLIFKIPNAVSTRIENLVQIVDILPTLLGVLKIEGQFNFDGNDIFQSTNQYVYGEFYGWKFNPYNPNFSLMYIRSEKWKLIKRDTGALELYDVENDPGERINVATQHPDVVREMENKLDEFELSSYIR